MITHAWAEVGSARCTDRAVELLFDKSLGIEKGTFVPQGNNADECGYQLFHYCGSSPRLVEVVDHDTVKYGDEVYRRETS